MKTKLIKPLPPMRVTGELMGRTNVQIDVSELIEEINKRIEDINRLIKNDK